MKEEALRAAFPDAFRDGESFADATMSSLAKMAKRGLLRAIAGIDSIPRSKDEIDEYIEKKALPVAVRNFSRDESYSTRPDYEEQLRAFTTAFSARLEGLLSQAG